MKRNIIIKILLGAVLLVGLIKIGTVALVEPWLVRKIKTALNEKDKGYIAEIGEVNVLFLRSGIEMKRISLKSKMESEGKPDLTLKIAWFEVKGIKAIKAIFKKDFEINEISFSSIIIDGMFPFSQDSKSPVIAPINIRVKRLVLHNTDVNLKDYSGSESYLIEDSNFRLYNIQIGKQDTISINLFEELEFEVEKLVVVTADSLYSFSSSGMAYSAATKSLDVDSFRIDPNYSYNNFSARHKYQTERFEAAISNLSFHELRLADFIKTGDLLCAFIEIGKIDLDVFRDNRKPFDHLIKPTFQERIYSFPGTLNIDSIVIISGNIAYSEHASGASEFGTLSFLKMDAKLYNVYNDTIYKTESKFLELKAKALLMGTGKIAMHLKSRLYENDNTFSLEGNLAEFDISKLNPFLEKNAFIYATSGQIDEMNFDYIADDSKAQGKMILIYNGLEIAVKNKISNDTTALKERIVSFIANKKIVNSNPRPGEEIRIGVIDYDRDPERFLFNYAAQSILTGVKSSIE